MSKLTTQLHEILAVEGTAEGHFKEMQSETTKLFNNKPTHFSGSNKQLQLFAPASPEITAKELSESEVLAVSTTVADELEYLAKVASNFFNVVLQKDEANQRAKADIIVDGVVLARDVPSSTLLGLENKLKQVRLVLEAIPTLAPGRVWVDDPTVGANVVRDNNPEVRTKTAKTFQSKILVQPTDKHPAQIEKWEEVQDIGAYTITKWSGMISTAQKSRILAKFDKLSSAIKQARQRANTVDVDTSLEIGSALFDYLLK
jgi:hypothetical protein